MATQQETTSWLTPAQYAEKHDVPYETVRSWLRKKLLRGAKKVDLQSKEHRYLIPADTPRPQLKRGPKTRLHKALTPTQVNIIMKHFADNLSDTQRAALAERWFTLAQEANSKLDGLEQNTWIHWFQAEHDNLCATLDYYSNQPGTVVQELQLAVWLIRGWEYRGHYEEALARMQHALSRQAPGDSSLKATGLARMGHIAYRQGSYQQAKEWLATSITMGRNLKDHQSLTLALNVLGRVYKDEKNYEQARLTFQDALKEGELAQEPKRAGWAYRGLGQVAQGQGDLIAAKVFHQRSLDMQEKIGNLREIAAQCDALGQIAMAEKDFPEARRYYERSLGLRQGGGMITGTTESYLNLGQLEETAGNKEAATGYFRQALELAQQRSPKHMQKAADAIARLQSPA